MSQTLRFADPDQRFRASHGPAKELRLMLAFFGDARVPHARPITPAALPSPARELLVHNGHMTEMLESHHAGTVDVHPYSIHRNGEIYGRKLDLSLRADGRIVMTGLMIFNLQSVAPAVREEILAAQTPLGRILINHQVLREVTSEAYLQIAADDPLAARFGLAEPRPVYGRLATIFCDGVPAVDLLEVVAPA